MASTGGIVAILSRKVDSYKFCKDILLCRNINRSNNFTGKEYSGANQMNKDFLTIVSENNQFISTSNKKLTGNCWQTKK